MTNNKLTGRKRYRQSFFGKLILQVEEERRVECYHDGTLSPPFYVWRDATVCDQTCCCNGK